CHFKGDVISKVSFLSSNLQHVTFECKEIGDCNFTTATVDNVIFKCRRLHNVIFIKVSGQYLAFCQNILGSVLLSLCHFKGDVISKVSFLSSNLQHVTFECKEIGDCNFTTATVDNVI
ncbi:pentapeptide repeat-containing protein, partial [Escherichia coli]